MIPGMVGPMAGMAAASLGPFEVTYLGSSSNTTPGTTSNHTINIGAQNNNKTVFAVVVWGNAGSVTLKTVSSASVAGVSSTILGQANKDDGVDESLGICGFYSAVPAGSGSVTITVNYSSSVTVDRVDVYSVDQLWGLTQYLDVANQDSSNPLDPALLLDVAEGGAVIAGCISSTPSNNLTWTGVTEAYETNLSVVGDWRVGGGFINGLAAQTDRNIQVSQSISGSTGFGLCTFSIVRAP